MRRQLCGLVLAVSIAAFGLGCGRAARTALPESGTAESDVSAVPPAAALTNESDATPAKVKPGRALFRDITHDSGVDFS